MKEAFHPGEPRYAAVHMRVEDDWVPFCHEKEISQQADPEYRACFGAGEIAETFMNTPALRENRNILLLYAADNFTPDLKGRQDWMKTGSNEGMESSCPRAAACSASHLPKCSMQSIIRWILTLRSCCSQVWPPDVAVANPILLNCFANDGHAGGGSGPTYTERSIVSMFMAANADAFMSDWHSTFRKGGEYDPRDFTCKAGVCCGQD